MQSRCRKFARDCSISITSFTVGISLVGAITILTSQNALADSSKGSMGQAASDTVLMAQVPQNDGGASTGDGTASGSTGSRSSSGMSDRIRKYMNDDGPPGGLPPGGPRTPGGPDDMGGGDKRERLRQRIQQMTPEQREQFMQEMKERRMRKRGMSDGGMDNRFMGGPDGGPPGGPPDGGPGFGGRPGRPGGNGISEYGFKRNNVRRDFSPGDKGMKGKLFGREPLDLTVLNLTAEQKAKIQSMRTVDGQKSRQLQAELRQRRDKFKDMLFDPTASSEQILSTHREINKLQSQTQDIMLNDFLGIRKLLTKEQLELLPQVRPDDSRRPSPRLGAKAPPDGEPPSVDTDR